MAKKVVFTCAYCGKEYETNNYNKNAKIHFCCSDHRVAYQREVQPSRGGFLREPNCVCEFCGKPIHKSPYQLKTNKHTFCSRVCQNTFQAREKSKRVQSDINAKCAYCGREFHKSNNDRGKHKDFCNKECQQKYYAEQNVDKTCVVCGKKFKVVKSRANTAICCSVACQIAYQRRFYRIVRCAYCGKKFQIDKTRWESSNTKLFFCKNKCVGKYYSGTKSPTYKGTRNVSQILRGYFQLYQRPYIFKRDKSICQICGAPADHVHHIYPFSQIIHDFRKKHPDIDITKDCYYVAAMIIKEMDKFKDMSNLMAVCIGCHEKLHAGDSGSFFYKNKVKGN